MGVTTPIGSLVVGKLYSMASIHADPYAHPEYIYTGEFAGLMFDGLAVFYDTRDRNGRYHGNVSFNHNDYSFMEIGPSNNISIDVKQSELPEHDPILYMPYTQGQRVIRIGKRNNWIYDRTDLEQYWDKKGVKSNPLVSADPIDENTIEYGTLNILPDGGRRRRTKKSKRRSRKTRRRV